MDGSDYAEVTQRRGMPSLCDELLMSICWRRRLCTVFTIIDEPKKASGNAEQCGEPGPHRLRHVTTAALKLLTGRQAKQPLRALTIPCRVPLDIDALSSCPLLMQLYIAPALSEEHTPFAVIDDFLDTSGLFKLSNSHALVGRLD